MRLIDQCAHRGIRLEGMLRLHMPAMRQYAGHEGILDRALDKEARAGGAHLALVVEDRGGSGLGGLVQIGRISEHEVRALATALQPGALEIRFPGALQQPPTDGGGAGERQRIHVHVQRQRFARPLTMAGKHIEHAIRHPRLGHQRGQADRAQRRALGGLEHHGIARRQGWRDLPRCHQQREVPRHDHRHHAHRLAGDQAQRIQRGRGNLAVHLVHRLGGPAQAAHDTGQIALACVADRLAHVQGFQQRERIGVLFHQVGQPQQHLLAMRGRRPRPVARIETAPRRFDRPIDVRRVGVGHLHQHAAIDRADAVIARATGGVHVAPIDEGLALEGQCIGLALPVVAGACGGHRRRPHPLSRVRRLYPSPSRDDVRRVR